MRCNTNSQYMSFGTWAELSTILKLIQKRKENKMTLPIGKPYELTRGIYPPCVVLKLRPMRQTTGVL